MVCQFDDIVNGNDNSPVDIQNRGGLDDGYPGNYRVAEPAPR